MAVRRPRCRFELRLFACVCAGLFLAGCSQEEDMRADADTSPFDPRPETSGLPSRSELPGGKADPKAARVDPMAGMNLPGKSSLDTRFGAGDVEKQLRIAMRSARDGQPEQAAQILDQVLAVEPINREALLGRSALWFDQWRKETAPAARLVAIEKAVALARALRRAYDAPKPNEEDLFARVIYTSSQELAQAGRFDDAIKRLNEAAESGFESYFAVEIDEKMIELRKTPGFHAALKTHDEARLAMARERVKERLAKPLDLPFNFTLRDLDLKPVSLADFKGKVVLVDYWGLWCGPCRQAIPSMIALYRNRRSKGLEIVGIDYEKDIPDESKAREALKTFTKEAGVTYPCLIGDEPTILQIPDFKGFPTTVIVDRAGKVRLLVRENDSKTPELIRDVIEVLLEEPVPQGGETKKKADAKAPSSGSPKKPDPKTEIAKPKS